MVILVVYNNFNVVKNLKSPTPLRAKCPHFTLLIGKNKKVIGLMKDELGGEIITEFITLRPKTYSYLTDDSTEDKNAKGTKKCVIKKMIKFDDLKNAY